MKGKFEMKKYFEKWHYKKTLIFIITAVCFFGVLITSLETKKYNLSVGDIAKFDIKAPMEIRDEIGTQSLIQEAVDQVPLQYNKKSTVKSDSIDSINNLFLKLNQEKKENSDSKAKESNISEHIDISMTDSDIDILLSADDNTLKSLQSNLIQVITDVYNSNISDQNLEQDTEKAKNTVQNDFNQLKFSTDVKNVGIDIADSLIKPNFFYDKDKTEELQAEAMKKVHPLMIKKDQIVVKEGEPVTKYQIEILKSLGLLNSKNIYNLYIYLSLGAIIIIILSAEWFYLYKFHIKIFKTNKMLLLINIVSLISLVMVKVTGSISLFLVPIAFEPILLTLLVGRNISIVISSFQCVLIAILAGFDSEIIMLAVFNAIIGSIMIRKIQERNDIFFSSLYIAFINALAAFACGFLVSTSIVNIFIEAGYSFIQAVISGVLAIGVLPVFEGAFEIATTIKLLELSNPNHPLLKKLLLEAPGTYHHSILVANLAEVAAEAVGANPVLVRVSSYYHDIGKTKRPYFFKENQFGIENPHNKISSNLSALIIIAHVKDGIELAKQYKIPKVIRDIIEQHHGTTLVRYFYVTAKNSSNDPDKVSKQNFMYPGPVPDSKEAAIIMLADGVEAAVRSIQGPTKNKIEEMVNKIINERLNEKQLDNCDLTLKDIKKIREAFIKALNGIYHQRIEYPEDKWIKKLKGNKA